MPSQEDNLKWIYKIIQSIPVNPGIKIFAIFGKMLLVIAPWNLLEYNDLWTYF